MTAALCWPTGGRAPPPRPPGSSTSICGRARFSRAGSIDPSPPRPTPPTRFQQRATHSLTTPARCALLCPECSRLSPWSVAPPAERRWSTGWSGSRRPGRGIQDPLHHRECVVSKWLPFEPSSSVTSATVSGRRSSFEAWLGRITTNRTRTLQTTNQKVGCSSQPGRTP
jgi:hypothetical protein